MGRLWTITDGIRSREAADQFEPCKHVRNELAEWLKAEAAKMAANGEPLGLLSGEKAFEVIKQGLVALGVLKPDIGER
jgi:hypothetical protein